MASLIPNAGAYLQQQLGAKSAYDRAVAALKAQRRQRQVSAGLGEDWSVDPRAQYGAYQAMLQGQGMDLDRAMEASQQRGLFGKGLGNQGESMLRYGQAVQSLGFKNQLADWEREYGLGMADAARQREAENLAAMQGAYGSAVESGDWGYPYDEPPVGGQGGVTRPVANPVTPKYITRPTVGSIQGASRNPWAKKQPQVTTILRNRQAAGRM